jgi:hypothetical protein
MAQRVLRVEVESAAEALDKGHRAALRAGPRDARSIRQPAADDAMQIRDLGHPQFAGTTPEAT